MSPVVPLTALGGLLKKVTWAGNPLVSLCDHDCTRQCVRHVPRATNPSGYVMSDFQVCIASCGCGAGFDHLFVETQEGTYLSPDGGTQWNEVGQLLGRSANEMSELSVEVSPMNADFVAVWARDEPLAWITRDGCSTWHMTRIAQEGSILHWRWHPERRDWAFVLFNDPRQLCLTSDTITWHCGGAPQVGLEEVKDAWWDAHFTVLYTVETMTASRGAGSLYAVHSRQFAMNSIIKGEQQDMHFRVHQVERFGDGKFLAVAPLKRRENQIENETMKEKGEEELGLWVLEGDENGSRWKAVRLGGAARAATGQVALNRLFDQNSLRKIEILTITPHLVHIFVPAIGSFGHVWMLDMVSLELEPSLTYVMAEGGQASWQNIDGVPGIAIANRMVFDPQEEFNPLGVHPDAGILATPKGIRTMQTFDFGAVWTPLEAPQCPRSAGKCHKGDLRLHLKHWVTCAAAPGIVLAVGNEAAYRRLHPMSDGDAVFISLDAGLRWKNILPGHWRVNMLARGDIIVAMMFNEVKYSVDHGSSWSTASVTSGNNFALATHPSHLGYLALVTDGSTVKPLDFSAVLPKECNEVGSGGLTPESDYERWSPADMFEDAHPTKRRVCLQGIRTSFVRRKSSRACRSKVPQFGKEERPCACTLEDYRCSLGYARNSTGPSTKCVKSTAPEAADLCERWVISAILIAPMTKLPDNRCDGGVNFTYTRVACTRNILLLLFWSLVLIVVATFGRFLARTKGPFARKLPHSAAELGVMGKSKQDESLRRRIFGLDEDDEEEELRALID